MTWGIPTDTFLQIHVVLSLVALVLGLIVVVGLVAGTSSPVLTGLFLLALVLTSVTGFPLPPFGFDPARAVGVTSLVLLAAALIALYGFHAAGAWRWIFIVAAVMALYLDAFVGVVQSFQKLAFLQPFASAQPVAHVVVLVAFVALGVLAVRRFQPAKVMA